MSETQMPLDENATLPDIGFRVFKLETTNLKPWDSSPIIGGDLKELERRLIAMLDIVKGDRTDEDVVYEGL